MLYHQKKKKPFMALGKKSPISWQSSLHHHPVTEAIATSYHETINRLNHGGFMKHNLIAKCFENDAKSDAEYANQEIQTLPKLNL